jgi:RimJ/RimL family protein N-acetyltransferase
VSVFQRVRAIGTRRLLWRGLSSATRALIFRKDVLLVFAAEECPEVNRERASRGITEWRWLDNETLREFQQQQPSYLSSRRLEVFGAREELSDRAFGLIERDRLVNLGWVRIAREVEALPEIGHRLVIRLDRAEPIIYDCWTPPEHRGHGHYPLALREASNQLLAEYQRVWIYCRATNRASARGIEKAGFVMRFTLTRTRFFGLEWRTSKEFGEPVTD